MRRVSIMRVILFVAVSMRAEVSVTTHYNLNNHSYNLGSNSSNSGNNSSNPGNTTTVKGMCAGNTNPSEDITCPAGYAVKPSVQGAPSSLYSVASCHVVLRDLSAP
jgi:hypothetical protein